MAELTDIHQSLRKGKIPITTWVCGRCGFKNQCLLVSAEVCGVREADQLFDCGECGIVIKRADLTSPPT